VTDRDNHNRHYTRSYRTTRPYAYDQRQYQQRQYQQRQYQYQQQYQQQYQPRYDAPRYDPRSRYGYDGYGQSNGYYDNYGYYRR
jgi:hypothetical protein